MLKIAPSILSADFSKLGEDIVRIDNAGADMVHIDIMDGVFVPNISFGMPVVKAIRKYTKLPFDVHLMIVEPQKYIKEFVACGADYITFHIEAIEDPEAVRSALKEIREAGVGAGLSVKPKTPAEAIFPYLDLLDGVLVMTVEPGFGNQKMIPECLAKVKEIRAEADKQGFKPLISMDGGMNLSTAEEVRNSGVDMAVAGSAVFGAPDAAEMIKMLRG